jgi:hypothetical protein
MTTFLYLGGFGVDEDLAERVPEKELGNKKQQENKS